MLRLAGTTSLLPMKAEGISPNARCALDGPKPDVQDVCVVLPPTSWQGGPLQSFRLARPRCIPPACGSDQGIEPIPEPRRTYPRSISRGRLRSPCTHRAKGLSHPLATHSQGLETCLSTCTEPCTRRLAVRSPIRGAFLLPPIPP